MVCNRVLNPPTKTPPQNGKPPVLKFLPPPPPPVLKLFNSPRSSNLLLLPFDWKQTRCKANAQTSYPT